MNLTTETSTIDDEGMCRGYDDEECELMQLSILYVIQGSVMFIGNALLLLPIVLHQGMRIRNEYLLIGALALADSINGSAYVEAGIYRWYTIHYEDARAMVPRLHCLIHRYSNLAWSFFEWSTGTMLTAISVDRLLLVSNPTWYLARRINYTRTVIALAYAPGITSGIISIVIVLTIPATSDHFLAPALCVMNFAQHPMHAIVHSQILSLFALLSVLVFIGVVIVYRCRTTQSVIQALGPSRLKAQRRMSISMGISCLLTLCLNVIPISFDVILNALYPHEFSTIKIFCYILANTNSILNLFVYLIRHKEVRRGLLGVLKWQHLPLDMNNWVVPSKSQSAVQQQPPTNNWMHGTK